MITTTYNYTSGMSFIYDPNMIGFDGTRAFLLLQNNPAQSFTPTLSASTFNPSLLQYTSGAINQVDQRPANATFYAAWASTLDANWSGTGNGSLSVTSFNSAAITSGKLDLTGSTNKYITFSPIGNADSAQIGSIEFEYTPNYSGTPSSTQLLFGVGESQGSYVNALEISHYTDGNLYFSLWDSSGSSLLSANGAWNPTSGTTYTILCQYNGVSGVNSVYINGTLFAQTTQTFSSRTNSIAFGVVGQVVNGPAGNANFSISNLSVYSAIVTPSTPVLTPTIYALATGRLPEFSYAGVGDVQEFTGLTISDANMPGYIFNGMYFNGSIWVTSSGSYAESNTATFAIANISTLPSSNTLQIDVVFPASNSHASLTSIAVNYTGQIYPTSGPTIAPHISLAMDQLDDFMDIENVGSDAVGWYLRFGGQNHWFNGSAWAISNGTFAQSNPAEVISDNASSLPISLGVFLTPYAILHSNDGSSTPELFSLTLSYDYFSPPPPGPNKCSVFGYLYNERGVPIVGATMTVTNLTTFVNQGVVEVQGMSSVVSDIDGYFHLSLFETTTVVVPLQWSVIYPPTGSPSNSFNFGKALIPNAPEVNFSSLVFS